MQEGRKEGKNVGIPGEVCGDSMSPVQPTMTCSCVPERDLIPLIIAACPCLAPRLHFGLGLCSSSAAAVGTAAAGSEGASEGMSDGWTGGVAGGLRIPGLEEECRVAVRGR